jgi:outer membrane receptor protein involved in Fe transport
LRGINTGGIASTVGVYVDETTFGSSSGLVNGAILTGDFDTFDIARVEVLRGPQGTLYGASSLGGVLKYVTNAPKLDAFQARVRGGFESVDGGDLSYSGSAVVNVPVSASVAIRATGFYRNIGGFIDSIGTAGSDHAKNINESKVSGGRAAMLFQPSDDISIKLSAFLQDIDNGASNTVDSDALTGKTLYGGFTQSQYVPQEQDVRYRVYNATAVFGLGFADLTSATSYATLTQDFRDDYTVLLGPLSYLPRAERGLQPADHARETTHAGAPPVVGQESARRVASRRLLHRREGVDRSAFPPGHAGNTRRDCRLAGARRRWRELEVPGVRGLRERDRWSHGSLRSHVGRPL